MIDTLNWPQKINLLDHDYEPEVILSALDSLITDSRRKKIIDVVSKRSRSLIPVLENIYDRGNISAVMRSAEAFGFYDFNIINSTNQFKESARVTQGADKWLSVKKWKSTKDAFLSLKDQGIKIYTTALTESSIQIQDLDFTNSVALVLGNEKEGVSKEALELSDGNVLIPMVGFTQSFNISVAAALCFQEANKKSKVIDEKEQKALRALYTIKSLQYSPEKIVSLINQNTKNSS